MKPTKNFSIGINTYGDAISFIFRNHLGRYFLFPIILNFAIFFLGFWGTSSISDWALDSINAYIHPENWTFAGSQILYGIIEWSLWLIIRVFFFFFYVWFGGYIILILMSPVFALLSEKTEEIITGKEYPFNLSQFINDILRGIRLALRNLFIELGITILCFFAGFIPIIGILAPFITIIAASYFYGFSFIDYSLERRKMSIKGTSNYISMNGGMAIGNGAIFSLTLAIPYIGVLLAGFVSIVSVVAATLAVHELEDKESVLLK